VGLRTEEISRDPERERARSPRHWDLFTETTRSPPTAKSCSWTTVNERRKPVLTERPTVTSMSKQLKGHATTLVVSGAGVTLTPIDLRRHTLCGDIERLSVRLRRVHANVYALVRELSGPRPLCRVPDACSRQHVWNRGARAILFETRTTEEIMGPQLHPLQAHQISMLQLSISPTYATWRAADIEE